MTVARTHAPRPAVLPRPLVLAVLGSLTAAYVVAATCFAVQGPDRPGLGLQGGDSALLALLDMRGISPRIYVGAVLGIDLTTVFVTLVAVGFILYEQRSDGYCDWLCMGFVAAAVGRSLAIAAAAGFLGLSETIAESLSRISAWLVLALLSLFPGGPLLPKMARLLAASLLALAAVDLALGVSGTLAAEPFVISVGISLAICVAAVQLRNFKHFASPVQRQQIKWLIPAVGFAAAGVAATSIVAASVPKTAQLSESAVLSQVAALGVNGAAFAFLGVSAAFSLLKYRLFDVDLIISRVVLNALLGAMVVAVYVIVVFGAGNWLAGSSKSGLGVIATVMVALLAVPVHARLQKWADRLVYGNQKDPYTVLSRLSAELAVTSLEEVKIRVRATVARELALNGAEVVLPSSSTAESDTAESAGFEAFPLVYEGTTLGVLQVPPPPGEELSSRERQLMVGIAALAATAVHSANMAKELRDSMEAAVHAREEERRRLHRELHDGFAPTLASLVQRVDMAEQLIATDPGESSELLVEVKHQLKESVEEIRRVIYGLRPPALDQLGLGGAIHEAWFGTAGIFVGLEDHVQRMLPAAVEVSAYRIAMEAIVNAGRHSGVHECMVNLSFVSGCLHLTVTDSGVGGVETAKPGVGIASMRARAAEVGGTLEIHNCFPGTMVRAVLPLGEK